MVAPPASSFVEQWVATAFSDAQRSYATHARASKLLVRAFARHPRSFLDCFVHALNRALVVFTREPAVERLVDFVAAFAATHSVASEGGQDAANFCSVILAYLVEHCNAASKSVRFRAVQVIAATLKALPEDAEISDDIWDPLQGAMLARAADKIPRVRAAAALALCRIQVSGDPEDDPVAAQLIAMLSTDSSAAVRKAALHSVAVCDESLPHILRRTRDVNDDVRKVAYQTLASKLNPECLPVEERVEVLETGLKDRSEGVRSVCRENLLITGWLEGACEGNVFELAELLGCSAYEDQVLHALRIVLRAPNQSAMLDAIQIDVNNLTPADILVLRAMSDVDNGSTRLEKYIPSTSAYAEVLMYYSVDDFASQHLLALSKSVDTSDEAGRRALEGVLRKRFLASPQVSEVVVPYAVRAMHLAVADHEAASRVIMETVRHDILGSFDPVASLSASVNVDENEVDPETVSWKETRALNICQHTLRGAQQASSSSAASNGVYVSLVQLAALPKLMDVDIGSRQTALECLALFCLLDGSGSEAKSNFPLFIQACRNDVELIQELALKSVVDFLMIFDFTDGASSSEKAADPLCQDVESIPDKDGDESVTSQDATVKRESFTSASLAEDAVSILLQYMTHADSAIRTSSVQGLARLLFARRITPNPTILSRLLIAHHNPTTEDDTLLRQCLSVFFPAFAMSTAEHRLALEGAFMQTCRLLLHAPQKSPLSTVPVLKVAQFLLHLTNPALVARKRSTDFDCSADTIHERIAEALLNEIIDSCDEDDETAALRIYAKILTSLRLSVSDSNVELLVVVKKLAGSAIDAVDDKRTLASLHRFAQRVDALNTSAAKETNSVQEYGEGREDEDEIEHCEATSESGAVSEPEALAESEALSENLDPNQIVVNAGAANGEERQREASRGKAEPRAMGADPSVEIVDVDGDYAAAESMGVGKESIESQSGAQRRRRTRQSGR